MKLTYANAFSEYLSPLLILIRKTGFFEATIYMPLMTMAAVLLFVVLKNKWKNNGTLEEKLRAQYRRTCLFVYFTLCFIATNSTAVAFKTMIFEETDYDRFFWYLPLVSPLHFYITSIAAAMLWLVTRNKAMLLDKILCVYIQLGLIGGYCVSTYRFAYEPFDLIDPTSGVSSLFLYAWFGILNLDIVNRYLTPNHPTSLIIVEKSNSSGGELG